MLTVTAGGSVVSSIYGQVVTLSPGESWERSRVDVFTAPPYSGTHTTVQRFINYGWQDRAKIQCLP